MTDLRPIDLLYWLETQPEYTLEKLGRNHRLSIRRGAGDTWSGSDINLEDLMDRAYEELNRRTE